MACKLFYQYGAISYPLGTFKNRKGAEYFWNAVKEYIETRLGTDLTPIYVETGKRRN